MRQCCKNCRYSLEVTGRYDEHLSCRRRAPIRSDAAATYENGYGRGAFPQVLRSDWCGEWAKVGEQPREREPETEAERMWDAFWNGCKRPIRTFTRHP